MKNLALGAFIISMLLGQSARSEIIKAYSTTSLLSSKLSGDEQYWLVPMGPLSRTRGVTSSYGPLGTLGPFGDNLWNATTAFTVAGNWEAFARVLAKMNGPLSSSGPVFLTTELGQAMINFNVSSPILAPGGVLHSLGNSGPLGPLGIAGMLGPNGAHGLSRNSRGDYIDINGRVIQSLRVKTHEGIKILDLYELYKPDRLRSSEIFDTSFAIRTVLDKGQSVSLRVVSKREQWVNVLVVNEYELDSFSLTVTDEAGSKVISNDELLSNFVSVKVRAGTKLQITATHRSTYHYMRKPLRLFVTGSEGSTEVSRPFHFTQAH